MRLTTFSDYAVRTMMYLALHPDRFVTIQEIASAFRISANHLMKVVQHLVAAGEIFTLRGPHGGLRLVHPAAEIPVGRIVRSTEADLELIACAACVIQPAYALPGLLDKAVAAFLAVLDAHSIADLLEERGSLQVLLRRPDKLQADGL